MLKKRRQMIDAKELQGSKRSLRSHNPSVALPMSSKNSRRKSPEVPKAGTLHSAKTTVVDKVRKMSSRPGIPEDAAVHFGNFYCVERETGNNNRGGGKVTKLPVLNSPRFEFTRQMVHKLERLAGTEYYSQQISALLEDIAESPDFSVEQLPEDDFLPCDTSDPRMYPLWYKEPENVESSYDESSTFSNHALSDKREIESSDEAESTTSSRTNTMTVESRRSFHASDSMINDKSSSDDSTISIEMNSNSGNSSEKESSDDCDEIKIAISVK